MPELNQSAKSWKILTYLKDKAQPCSAYKISQEAGIFKNPASLTSTRIESAITDLCYRGLIQAKGLDYAKNLCYEITDKGQEFLAEFNEDTVTKWRCLG